MKSKNKKLRDSFNRYLKEHPEQRFWQALRNWSGYRDIYARKINEDDFNDTFYKEGK